MTAFVTVTGPVGSAASRFVGTTPATQSTPRPAVAQKKSNVSMVILDGLDTVNQSSYSFSRYILGPFTPKILSPNSDDGERELLIKSAYRHIFGNAYIMEEERAELAIAESQFKLGAIPAKEFVRALAKSSAYKTRFFEGASQYRFVELNFMHLLGRAPDSQEEVAEHIQRYVASGVDADIDSYIDSEEYDSVFGQDNIPFLRFRGAYTPCDSFNRQCALKGGWANSDKAMGGAAISGYNGSDGQQNCSRIGSYAAKETTPFLEVAENTPLKTTAPNWYAIPDPAVPPKPGFVSEAEVAALQAKVEALNLQYEAELARKQAAGKDALAPFRVMVQDMGPMLDRGGSYSGGDPLLANPYSRPIGEESPLASGGCKSSDYKRFHNMMESDTLSRIEKDLEEAKASLRVLSAALAASTPVTPPILLPGQVAGAMAAISAASSEDSRPRIKITARAAKPVAAVQEPGMKIGPITLPKLSMPSMPSIPSMPELPKIPNPFAKK